MALGRMFMRRKERGCADRIQAESRARRPPDRHPSGCKRGADQTRTKGAGKRASRGRIIPTLRNAFLQFHHSVASGDDRIAGRTAQANLSGNGKEVATGIMRPGTEYMDLFVPFEERERAAEGARTCPITDSSWRVDCRHSIRASSGRRGKVRNGRTYGSWGVSASVGSWLIPRTNSGGTVVSSQA